MAEAYPEESTPLRSKIVVRKYQERKIGGVENRQSTRRVSELLTPW